MFTRSAIKKGPSYHYQRYLSDFITHPWLDLKGEDRMWAGTLTVHRCRGHFTIYPAGAQDLQQQQHLRGQSCKIVGAYRAPIIAITGLTTAASQRSIMWDCWSIQSTNNSNHRTYSSSISEVNHVRLLEHIEHQ